MQIILFMNESHQMLIWSCIECIGMLFCCVYAAIMCLLLLCVFIAYLTELNEKTNSMLKLIEEDADSFAQRAEMYYKKRPELISMVEDFYRAHRSLAERFDLLKSDRAARVRSPLRHSFSLPKEEYEYVFDSIKSVKSFDSFTETTYSSEECAESEVDDPDQEDEPEIDQNEREIESQFRGGVASYDELMQLKYELSELREVNEMQKNIIKQKDDEKEELVKQLSDSIREMREEMVAVRETTEHVSVPCDEVTKSKDEIDKLKLENMYEKEQMKKKAEALALKEEEKWEYEEMKIELAKVIEEKDREKKEAIRQLTEALREKEKEKNEVIRQLNDALKEKNKEKNEAIRQLNDALREKDKAKNETIRQLKDAFVEKDMEKKDVIRKLKDVLVEKDEEKREAIRQLSIAMENLREESKLLKKSLVDYSPKKSFGHFEILKGVNLAKLFNLSSNCQRSVVPL